MKSKAMPNATRESDVEKIKDDVHNFYLSIQSLTIENERLRQSLQHERELREDASRERELREDASRERELRLRLQISEELRRLPSPSK